MSKWNIYHKDGSFLTDVNGEQITVDGLEYSDSWMGECFVTIDFKNDSPISFEIGDYIIYRGETFELNYDPGKDKCAKRGSYGEGFSYESVKFCALQDELARTEFLDVVLSDNQLHYTSLPKFVFYVETIDDLLDRIQANLDEQLGNGVWKVFSRNKERSMQRGCSKDEWGTVYGEGTSDDGKFDSMSVTVDSQTCWEALALVNQKWDINFIIRNRCIYVGTAGVMTQNIFKYGLGKGLYEVDQNADSDQSIITRLRAYGSEKNLPDHYYADLGIKYKANITKVFAASSYVEFMLDLDYIDTYFKNQRKYTVDGVSGEQSYGWVLRVTFDYKTFITGYVTKGENDKCKFYSDLKGTQVDNGDEESKEALDAFINQVKAGNTLLYISEGINKKTIPYENKEYAENLPNNMSINRLMLPGFPHVSLSDFYDSLTEDEKKFVNPSGRKHVFSTDKYRPYIDSVNLEKIGLRSASQFFDTDDKTNGVIEIYPTIEEMVVGKVRVDEIYTGSNIEDNGRFEDGESVKNFDIYLNPAIDFDINELRNDDFSINMKDGMCGGRTFNVASATKIEGNWRLTLERAKDDSLSLYFPYNDYQINKGDHFVLTGIELPESYIRAASLKLLKYAIALLDKNDYTRYVYQPKVDEIFMARQHDKAMEDKTGVTKSLHDTLKAGDIMQFFDEDFGIDAQITIDQLTIKENEDSIPTYEVTLREEKEVGTIEKIQQQISSLENGNGGSGGGATVAQVKSQIASEGEKYFLSKLNDDTAQGTITFESLQRFLQGMKVGGQGQYGMDAFGRLIVDLAQSQDYEEETQTGFGFYKRKDGKYGLNISELNVWAKAVFNTLQIRELDYVGGNMVFSPAASKIFTVKEVYDSDGNVTGWKCYLLADNGTTSTINMWHKYDQAKCQTFNIAEGVYENVSNKYYWRLVTDVSRENEELTDAQGNVLYDGQKFAWVILSRRDCENENNDAPAAGDSIVADGNRSDTDRQNLIMIETEGDNAPRFIAYDHVNSYSHTGKDTWVMSPRKFIVKSDFIEITTSSGDKVKMANYRGEWQAGVEYGYYDEVTWMGTRWLCMVAEGTTTTSEPSEDNSEWMATTAIVRRKIIIDLKGQDTLDFGETLDVICSVWLGDKEIDTSEGWSWSVERDSGDKLEDDAWNASPKAKSFNGSIRIAFTASENDLGNEVSGVYGVVFTFKAWQDGNKAMALSATLSV